MRQFASIGSRMDRRASVLASLARYMQRSAFYGHYS
jgi:hypothetical protein